MKDRLDLYIRSHCSRLKSATTRFNLLFSSSSCRGRLYSEGPGADAAATQEPRTAS